MKVRQFRINSISTKNAAWTREGKKAIQDSDLKYNLCRIRRN